jgi:hypothetical protein
LQNIQLASQAKFSVENARAAGIETAPLKRQSRTSLSQGRFGSQTKDSLAGSCCESMKKKSDAASSVIQIGGERSMAYHRIVVGEVGCPVAKTIAPKRIATQSRSNPFCCAQES